MHIYSSLFFFAPDPLFMTHTSRNVTPILHWASRKLPSSATDWNKEFLGSPHWTLPSHWPSSQTFWLAMKSTFANICERMGLSELADFKLAPDATHCNIAKWKCLRSTATRPWSGRPRKVRVHRRLRHMERTTLHAPVLHGMQIFIDTHTQKNCEMWS